VGVMFAVIVLLTVVFVDYVTKHSIYYQTASIFRKLVKPELYDDTYSTLAVWPIEGGKPFMVRATFDYKGEPYSVERTIRCYQDRNFSEVSAQEFSWYVQLNRISVPLDDGGLFFSGIANLCDRDKGLSKDRLKIDRSIPFKYADSIADPTYIEHYNLSEGESGNIAIAHDNDTIDPASVEVRAFPIEGGDVKYASNVDEGVFTALFGERVWSDAEKDLGRKISFSFTSGFILFEAQWRQNPELVKFLKDVKTPTVVPRELVRNIPHEPGNSQIAVGQVKSFYSSKNLQSVRQNMERKFYVWLKLKSRTQWEFDFASVGVTRAFRRGCDDAFKNCSMVPITRDITNLDKLVAGNISVDVMSQPSIYLPQDKIIIRITLPRLYSIFSNVGNHNVH